MVKGTAVEGLAVGLDVDIKGANQQLENELSKTTKMIGSVFSSSFGAGIATVAAGAVGAIAAMGAAMALTVGASAKFEDSFAGIKKTVDASDREFKSLALSVRQLATEIPIATAQLNQIGELGGQLGVETSGLPIFIETIAKLGVATRLSTETAALSLARLQTIFQLPEQDIDNLASSLVDLGNNFAALEDEILSTALRLAAGAKVAGATVSDTLAIATALQAVGVQSQAGGTAMARVFQAITIALQGGQKEMQVFAQVTGLGVEGFRNLASENPAEALNVFLIGLKKAADEGRNLVDILDQLGLKQQRTIRALLAVSVAGDLLTETLTTANIAYDLNIALQEEATKRFDTAKSQAKLMKNAFTELRIEIGNFFLPAYKALLEAITGTALAMGDNDKATEGMTNVLKAFVTIVGTASAAVMFLVGSMQAFKVKAAEAGMSATAFRVQTAALTLSTKQLQPALILAAKAMTILQLNMVPIMAAFAALTVLTMAYMGAKNRMKKSVEAYTQAEAARLTIQTKVIESTKRLNELTQEALGEGLDPDNVPAIIAERERGKILEENMLKLEKIANMQFLNIGMGKGDFEGVDEADDAIQIFNKVIDSRKELDAALDQQEASNIFPNVENLTKQFSNEFDVTMEQAEEILKRGFTGIREFLTLESLADPTVFKRANALFLGYQSSIDAASNQAILGSDKMSESNQELVRSFSKDSTAVKDIIDRIRRAGSQEEELFDSRINMLKQYNAERAAQGLTEMDQDIFLNFPEEQRKVFEFIFTAQQKTNDELDETVVSITDMANAFDKAEAAAGDFRQTIDDIEPPEIIDFEDLQKGVQRVKDLKTLLGAGIFQAVQAGFPALALDFAEGGIEAENLGEMIAIVESGFNDADGTITAMNESIMKSNEEVAQLVQNTAGSEEEILQHIQEKFGISVNQLDLEKDREAIARVFASMEKVAKGDKADFLALTKEVLDAERNIKDAKQEILDLENKILEINADLVHDTITITNAKRDEVTKAQALADLNEVLAKFGKEGVTTNHEKLEILQAELNIQRLTDKIENKRSKRQQKNIRDKKKEVEFLKKAVEQGVVEQLDLDVAQEELDAMQAPMDQKEKDILTLQKEIAQAELDVVKARKDSLSPEVISAIESYNKALDVTSDREEEIARLTDELVQKNQDLKFEQAEVANRYQEILDKYPEFKDKSVEIAEMIGIPQQVMQSALDGMGKTVDKFIEYVNFAKAYRDSVTGHEGDADDFLPPIKPLPIRDDKYLSDRAEDSEARRLAEEGNLHTYTPSIKMPVTPTYTRDFSGGPFQSDFEVKQPQGYFSEYMDKIFGDFKLPDYGNYSGFNMYNTQYGGKRYGGSVPVGKHAVVGEMGPEVIMSTPGGTSVFSNKTGAGGSGVNIQNMNLNITGLPADPITARKVAQNIQRELLKLEKEGQAGTGLLNR